MNFHWKYLGGNTYDVFVGNGWENWTRIQVGRDYSKMVDGYRLPTSLLREIHNNIME